MQLANGDVNVQRQRLSDGFKGTDETVAAMSKVAMGIYGARSQKIRAAARNILAAAGVPEKDYRGEAIALGKWVRDNIRYLRDPYGQETIAHPEETLFNFGMGDCDDQAVLLAALLTSVGIPTRFKVMGQMPHQYSHVYLQAKPAGEWITMDPIMTQKPIGWEVPKNKRVIEKTFPVNGPDGLVQSGMQGVHGMSGLGFIGDPRVESHVESPFIPHDAGLGVRGHRPKGRPAYVQMPSGLDTDAPIDHMMAFPPNQNAPARYPTQYAQSIAPQVPQLTNRGVAQGPQGRAIISAAMAADVARHRQAQGNPRRVPKPAGAPAGPIPEGFFEESEMVAMNGWNEVVGPDALAGMTPGVREQSVPAYMQTTTVRQAPEGVDEQFSRAAQVFDPNAGDKVDYKGHFDMGEKPPIRPYTGVGAIDGIYGDPRGLMLPGMSGPGLGDGATGATTTSPTEPLPAGAPISQPGMSLKTVALIGAVIVGGLYFMNKRA